MLADDGVDMVVVIYLPFLGLKDIDVAKAVMKPRRPSGQTDRRRLHDKERVLCHHLSETQVNVPFFMFAEQAVEGLARLNSSACGVNAPTHRRLATP